MLLVPRVMKARYNISSDGVLLSLCGKPPTVSNTCLTTPHIADLVVVLRKRPSFKSGWRIIWIGLPNWRDDFSAVDRKLQTLRFPRATFKDEQMDYDLTVDKNYANTGQKWSWGVWVKRREIDKSLISLFAFHCPVFGKGFSPQGTEARGADTGGAVSSGSSEF